jgi:hypothetical protein
VPEESGVPAIYVALPVQIEDIGGRVPAAAAELLEDLLVVDSELLGIQRSLCTWVREKKMMR